MSDNAPNPLDYGYARSFPGFWLAPGGLRFVSEADAIAEIAGETETESDE